MKKFLILAVLFICACNSVTYRRTKCVNCWYDKWDGKYSVWCTKTYLRQNDSMISIKYDTTYNQKFTGHIPPVITNHNPPQ